MVIIENILIGIYALVCLAIIVLALVQSKEDQGASGTIVGGSSSSSSFFEKNKGRTKEGKLKKWTIILGIIFVILTIIIGIIYMI